DGFPQLGTRPAMQQVVEQDRASGALAAQVPGGRQAQGLGLGKQAVQYRLVFAEVADAGARSAGQPVSGKVAGQDGQVAAERPVHQVAVQAHVVVITVQHQQGADRALGQPDLGGEPVGTGAEAAQPGADPGMRAVQPVEAAVVAALRWFRAGGGQGGKAGGQVVGLEVGHAVPNAGEREDPVYCAAPQPASP